VSSESVQQCVQIVFGAEAVLMSVIVHLIHSSRLQITLVVTVSVSKAGPIIFEKRTSMLLMNAAAFG